MGFSIQDVKQIKKQFKQEYLLAAPYLRYVSGCGISRVGIKDKTAPLDAQGDQRDLCIKVSLRRSLPMNLSLPAEYHGVKIITQVIGEIYSS